MSFDLNDFLTHDKPRKDIIKTASGEGIKVSGAGTISFTKNLTLKNCLFVPGLSHKLLSVSQLTSDLDCTTLMKPGCCIVQDAQTGKIIGRGIERGGLYYLEEETQKGKATLVRGSEERQLWTWHRRLGHPSVGYLEKLFPNFVGLKTEFKCETCILAKSHKHSYSNSLNKVDMPFMLVYSDV